MIFKKPTKTNKNQEEYSVYSKFDIQKHKETNINYLEVLILEDGTVEYAVPSHQAKALEVACRKLNKSKQEIADMRPRTYYWDYLTWILGIAGAVSVWVNCGENLIRYKTINKKQITTLKKLKIHGLYKGSIPTIEEVKE